MVVKFWAVWDALVEHQGTDPTPRLMKIGEEFGEVVQAWIGVRGLNKRKGFTHSAADVANELCDVIITAKVALHDWVDDPETYLAQHEEKIRKRVKKEGS